MVTNGLPELTLSSAIVPSPNQLSADVGEEVVILGIDAGEYYSVSNVGARVWQLIQEQRTVESIVSTIVAEYDVDRAPCERDVLALLGELEDEGLVTIQA